MNETSDSLPQHKAGFTVPWSVAAILGCVGALALVVAISTVYKRNDPDVTRADRDAAKLETQLTQAESALNAEREKGKGPAAELKSREEKNKSDMERFAARESKLRELEAKNRTKISQVQQQIEETKRQTENEKKLLPSQTAQNDPDKIKFTAAMADTQNAIVTIVSPQGVVGTGFFISGFKQPTIITTLQVAPPDVELSVKLRNAENAGDQEPFDGTAKLIYADKESGLAFLLYTPKEQAKLATLSKKAIREAQRGEKIYAIATLVHGGEHFGEFSATAGNVSAEVVNGDRKFLQLAVPTNIGSYGAPVLGADAALLGVVAARVEGQEKSILAVPAVEIPNAIKRMVASLSK